MIETRHLRLRDHATLVLRHGRARGRPPVVLVHALGLDHRMWDGVARQLADDREVITYDMRLHGAAADAPATTLAEFADDLGEIADQFGIEQAHVAGISMGGAVAASFAARQPGRFASLTLICAPARSVPAFEERALSVERDGIAAQIEPTLQRWFDDDAAARQDAAVAYARSRIAASGVAQWAASWRALAAFDPQPLSREIRTTLVAGTADRSTPPAHMQGLLAIAPQARFRVIEGGTHMLALDRAADLAAELRLAIG